MALLWVQHDELLRGSRRTLFLRVGVCALLSSFDRQLQASRGDYDKKNCTVGSLEKELTTLAPPQVRERKSEPGSILRSSDNERTRVFFATMAWHGDTVELV